MFSSLKSSLPTTTAINVIFVLLGLLLAQTWYQHVSLCASFAKILPSSTPKEKTTFKCERPAYTLRMLSYDPFVAHLENFITPTEAAHLKALAEPKLQRSRVFNSTSRESVVSDERTSSTAFLPRKDPVIKCIRGRASEIQGHLYTDHMDVQATVYQVGQYFHRHHDCGAQDRVKQNWKKNGTSLEDDESSPLYRVSTIFGILEATCEDCGTSFPEVELDRTSLGKKICNFVDCSRDHLTVKAKTGSAVFWRNRLVDGSVDRRMIHEGLTLSNGTKYGLNIWSHERTEA